MRKYSAVQIIGFFLSFLLPPVGVWFVEGFGIDFWINLVLTLLGYLPGSIHSAYIWLVWVERKWQTHHGKSVTKHPFLIFSKEFEQRSRWKGNGQDGFFAYFDDNIRGGTGGQVGGEVDAERALPISKGPKVASVPLQDHPTVPGRVYNSAQTPVQAAQPSQTAGTPPAYTAENI